jgi:hypothetical protein
MVRRNSDRWENPSRDRDEPPPFMGTWNRIYAAIAVYTCILILSLYLMTRALNR